MRIQWDCFFGNSSTEEALMQFVEGRTTLSQLKDACWPEECKQEVDRMMESSLNIMQIEDRIVGQLRKRGFSVHKFKPHTMRTQRYECE